MQQGAGHPFYRSRLRYDRNLFIELKLCNEWGIPHSQFLEWDKEDRAKAIAFIYEEAAHCDLCGTAEWEWDEDKHAYAPLEHFCMGCYIKTVYSDSIDSGPGVTVRLTPTGTIEHAKRIVKEKRRVAMSRGR